MKNIKKVPVLRFHEFSGEWESKKMGYIGENIIGLTYSPNDIDNENGIIVLRSSNIKNDNIKLDDLVKVNTNITDRLLIKKNDIVICTRNGSQRLIGKNIIIRDIDIPMTFGAFMSVFRSSQNEFVYHLFKTDSYNEQIQANLGARINQITNKNLNDFIFKFPCPAEQQKIADFLTQIDNKINQLRQKKQLLERYKKGVMQQIFSQEIRFKDEGGRVFPEWEEKKLEEECAVLMCKRIFAEETSENEEIPFYKIGTLGEKPDVFISRKLFEEYKLKYNYPRIGEILITCSGTVGKCIPFDGRDAYYQDSNIIWIDNPKLNIINEFLYYLIRNINWGKLNSTTIARIYGADFRNLVFKYPKEIKEQTKIVDFLTALDEKIAIVEKQLHGIKQYKKRLLQQMFV